MMPEPETVTHWESHDQFTGFRCIDHSKSYAEFVGITDLISNGGADEIQIVTFNPYGDGGSPERRGWFCRMNKSQTLALAHLLLTRAREMED